MIVMINKMAERLPPSPLRSSTITAVKNLLDGCTDLNGTFLRGSYVRPAYGEKAFRAFFLIARAFNAATASGPTIDLEALRSSGDIEPIMKTIYANEYELQARRLSNPETEIPLGTQLRQNWADVHSFIQGLMKQAKINPSKDYSTREYLLSLAKPLINDASEFAKLKTLIDALGFSQSDGTALNRNEPAVVRFYHGLRLVGDALHLSEEAMSTLNTQQGLHRVMELILNDGIDPSDQNNIGTNLRLRLPSYSAYQLKADNFGIWRSENTFDVVKDLLNIDAKSNVLMRDPLVRLLERLAPSTYIVPVRRLIESQTWSSIDINNASTIAGAGQRVFISLAAIATLAKQQGLTSIEPTDIYKREIMKTFLVELLAPKDIGPCEGTLTE